MLWGIPVPGRAACDKAGFRQCGRGEELPAGKPWPNTPSSSEEILHSRSDQLIDGVFADAFTDFTGWMLGYVHESIKMMITLGQANHPTSASQASYFEASVQSSKCPSVFRERITTLQG